MRISKKNLETIKFDSINVWKNTPANRIFSHLGELNESEMITYAWYKSVTNFLIGQGVIKEAELPQITTENL